MHGTVDIYNNVLLFFIRLKKFADMATKTRETKEKINGFI